MGQAVFIGDELTAAGFRLVGLRVTTPSADDTIRVFDAVTREATLVILTAGAAKRLPRDRLEAAVLAAAPPIAIVPDATGAAQPPDMARAVRAALGVES